MTENRIRQLADKGFITHTDDIENLKALTEQELINKGFITHTCIFYGLDESEEEAVVEPEVNTSSDITPPADDDDTLIVDDDDAPIVDDGEESITPTETGETEIEE